MRSVRVIIDGETYITFEGIVECYGCEITWLREVYDLGLLGRGHTVQESIAIELGMLDRVADVMRMSVYQGIDLAVIAAILESD